jgi:ribosomal protein S18 acetylase RimI-like enzyme
LRPPVRLEHFKAGQAALVASWVLNEREALWLAPRTPPPITADKIRAWGGPENEQLVLATLTDDEAVASGGPSAGGETVAYGEVNVLPGEPGEYWLGHLIVAPRWRGCGLGRRLAQFLLQRAFAVHRARRISLIVFPDNHAAIRSYRAAGLRDAGYESHFFPASEQRASLLRMVAEAG